METPKAPRVRCECLDCGHKWIEKGSSATTPECPECGAVADAVLTTSLYSGIS